MLQIIGIILLSPFILVGVYLYLKSAYKLVKGVLDNEFTFIMIIRVFGIVMPLLGVIMGLV